MNSPHQAVCSTLCGPASLGSRSYSPGSCRHRLTRAHSSWIVIFISYHVQCFSCGLSWWLDPSYGSRDQEGRKVDCEGTQVLSQNRSFLCIIFKQDREEWVTFAGPKNPEGLVFTDICPHQPKCPHPESLGFLLCEQGPDLGIENFLGSRIQPKLCYS